MVPSWRRETKIRSPDRALLEQITVPNRTHFRVLEGDQIAVASPGVIIAGVVVIAKALARFGLIRHHGIALVCGLLIAGCGYSTDRTAVIRTKNSNNDRIRTVAVDIFESKEFRRGLELQLAEALTKRLEAETPFKIAKKGQADTLLTGEVREVRQSTIGRDFKTTDPRETTQTLLVSFQWKDLRTGEVLVNRPNFVQTVDYIKPLGEDFYHASERAMDRLAERMIEQLESPDW
jgi:hypothetical protein